METELGQVPAYTLTCPADQRSLFKLAQRGRGGAAHRQNQQRGTLSGPPSSERGGLVSSGLPSKTQNGKRRDALGSSHQPPREPTLALPRGASSGTWNPSLLPKRLHLGPAAGWLLPSVANRCSRATCSPGLVLRPSRCSLVYLMGLLPRMCLWEQRWGRGASSRRGGPGAQPAWASPFSVCCPLISISIRCPGWKRSPRFGGLTLRPASSRRELCEMYPEGQLGQRLPLEGAS